MNTIPASTASTSTATTRQIEALRDEAARAGDLEQVALCDAALRDEADARAECARVIRASAAMGD